MKIKTKIAVIVSIVSLVLFGSGGVFMGIYFFNMLDQQERLDIANKKINLVNYIQDRSFTQMSTLYDWAKWEDTYDFVNGDYPDYINANLYEDSIDNLNMTFIVYYKGNGDDQYHLYYDNGKGELVDFPGPLYAVISGRMKEAFQQGRQYEDDTGILSIGAERYLFAKTSITDGTADCKPNGVMFTGRRFDSEAMTKMEGLAGGEVSLLKQDEMQTAVTSLLTAAQKDANGIRSVSIKESNDALATYTMLMLDGKDTGVVLAVQDRREIYRSGLLQHNTMMGLFFALTVIILIVMMCSLHVFIAKPITKLIHEITNIVPSIHSPKRLEVKGRSELSGLSQSINGMLDKLEENFREINYGREQFNSLVGEMRQGFTVNEVILDAQGNPVDSRFIYANDSFKAITGIGEMDVAGKRLREVFPESADYWIQTLSAVALNGTICHIEEGVTISGRYVEISAYRPQPMQCALLLSDITERRRAELEREYVSYHDQMTGLYNRRYFDEALHTLDIPENLPLSIIIGDLNGLKFTNDAFGHETGDRLLIAAAEALLQAGRPQDVIARWGGDEFTILLPRTSHADAGAVCNRIRNNIARIEINSMNYSISLGYETKTRRGEDMRVLLKNAEDHMYRSKIKEDMSGRGNAIQAIMTTFQERNEREKEHSMRVSRLCRLIAEAMGFSYEHSTDMELAGLVHDIGKIAISDSIVNKRGKLTAEEWKEMKRHPEIGSRILCASNEMLVISQYVVAHHERWDGSGYPKGMAGKETPLQARILAVADSYDAITSMRPYKLKMEMKDAVAELKRCAGKQFDPEVVTAFIENVLGYQPDENGEQHASLIFAAKA